MPRRSSAIAKAGVPKQNPNVISISDGLEKRLYRPHEVAHYLGCTISFVEDGLRTGKIKFKILGKRKLINKKDADAYIESIPYADVEIKLPHLVPGLLPDTRNRDMNGGRTRWARPKAFAKDEAGNHVVYIC